MSAPRKKTGIEAWRERRQQRRKQKRVAEAADRFITALPSMLNEITAFSDRLNGVNLPKRGDLDG